MEAPLKDPSRVSKRDLEHVMKRIQRAGLVVDEQQDCIAQALRLRRRRLERERDELRLKQTNAYNRRDTEQEDRFGERIDLLARAVHCLEMATRQVSRLY